jgi:hypothetical protein
MLASLLLLATAAAQDPGAKVTLRGLVKGPDGHALSVPATVSVALKSADGSYQQQHTRSGAEGAWSLELEPGWQEVEVGVQSLPVELAWARPIRLGGRIEAPGLDPRLATVEYARAGVEGWKSVAPGADGRFDIGGLWPAKWRLRLRTQAGIGPEIEAGPKSGADLRLVARS